MNRKATVRLLLYNRLRMWTSPLFWSSRKRVWYKARLLSENTARHTSPPRFDSLHSFPSETLYTDSTIVSPHQQLDSKLWIFNFNDEKSKKIQISVVCKFWHRNYCHPHYVPPLYTKLNKTKDINKQEAKVGLALEWTAFNSVNLQLVLCWLYGHCKNLCPFWK